MRTGDLGFLSDGNLFVTGREGDDHRPGAEPVPARYRIERGPPHPALATGAGASFAVEVDGEERLVAVYEVDRHTATATWMTLSAVSRRAIVDDHELDPQALVLIRTASLPRTTSGKVHGICVGNNSLTAA